MVDEKELKGPFKEQFEQWLMETTDEVENINWKEEYSAKATERENQKIPPSSVLERIDLLCRTEMREAADIHYVVEIKDELNKKAVGQVLMYFYAYNRDLIIRSENSDGEYPMVFPVIGFRTGKEYYVNWLDFLDGFFADNFQLIRMSIDCPDMNKKTF
jgi:hypothetical protein